MFFYFLKKIMLIYIFQKKKPKLVCNYILATSFRILVQHTFIKQFETHLCMKEFQSIIFLLAFIIRRAHYLYFLFICQKKIIIEN